MFRQPSHRVFATHFGEEKTSVSGVAASLDMETGDLLKIAKDNIEKLKEKGKKVVTFYYCL